MKSAATDLLPGVLALLLAVPVAFLIYLVNDVFVDRPEKAVQTVAGLFAILLIIVLSVYLFVQRRSVNPWKCGLIVLGTTGVLLVSIYLYVVNFIVFFPADFLIWSESEFVNDILKFRTGYPIYTEGGNHESFIYSPGTQMLTYLLAWLVGKPTSIPVYRMVQTAFSVLAAVTALLCCRKLVELNSSNSEHSGRFHWGVVWLPLLFLMATNSLTNPYVHHLHNDSLAQLVSVIAYFLLIKYIATRDKGVLVLMTIIPSLGFLVKQSLAVWAVMYCVHLGVFDRPRSMKRLLTFALVSFSGIGIVLANCYFLWGDHFFYWTFTVVGTRGTQVSLLRSFQHILDAWPYVAIGLVGGGMLLRDKNLKVLFSPWVMWLFVILTEAYTSGIGWTRSHLGPGSLIAGIWFLAALSVHWPVDRRDTIGELFGQAWLRTSIAVAVGVLLFSGLGMVRIPTKPFPVKDGYRYIRDIEKEFEGQRAKDILLDVGTWVYIENRVIMKDSAIPIGDQGYSETSDFSDIRQRLEERNYSKILVRNLHSRDFWYDYWSWRKSSGIRQALLDNYDEIGSIAEVPAPGGRGPERYTFAKISILVPKPD